MVLGMMLNRTETGDASKTQLDQVKDQLANLEKNFREYYPDYKQQAKEWYRVQLFLSWYSMNKDSLAQQVEADLKSGRLKLPADADEFAVRYFVGFYAGVKYLQSRFDMQDKQSPPIEFSENYGNACYDEKKCSFFVGGKYLERLQNSVAMKPLDMLLIGINIGMHEATHALLAIRDGAGARPLSELATGFTHLNYALPIREAVALDGNFECGIRSVYTFLRKIEEGADPENYAAKKDIGNEYLAHMLAPYLFYKYLKQNDVLNLVPKEHRQHSVKEALEFRNDDKTQEFASVFCGNAGIPDFLRKKVISVFIDYHDEMLPKNAPEDPVDRAVLFNSCLESRFLGEGLALAEPAGMPKGYVLLEPERVRPGDTAFLLAPDRDKKA